GKMSNRRLVMCNDFVIIGPPDDPAKIKGLPKAVEALKRIAESQSRFVSRGDKSGTHVLEQGLWKQAGVAPKGAWYIESGAGVGEAEVRLLHRVGAGHGADPRHSQRPPRLHPDGSRNVPGVPEAGGPADPGREGSPAAERLPGDGGQSGHAHAGDVAR